MNDEFEYALSYIFERKSLKISGTKFFFSKKKTIESKFSISIGIVLHTLGLIYDVLSRPCLISVTIYDIA